MSNHDLALAQAEDRQAFIDIFQEWVLGVGKNVASLTGYVIDAEWLPAEEENALLADYVGNVKR